MDIQPNVTPSRSLLEDVQNGQVEGGDIAKVAVASAVGTMIEFYDFFIYSIATALVFNKIFFPNYDPLVGTLVGYTTLFIGYGARPLGGVIFGHLGDRVGRKAALMTTILLMGIGTVLIGLMPSYKQIGVLAPIGLIILRIVQGIGIGGEYGGGISLTAEHAPEARRGFYTALVNIGVPAGFLVPIVLFFGLTAATSEAAFMSWGWRVPFLFSVVLVGLGLFIRSRIKETPAFRRVLVAGNRAAVPVVEAVRLHSSDIVLAIGAKVAESGLFNVYAVFAITYCVTKLGLPRQLVLNGVLIGCALECLALPFFGALSDRIGRRKVYVGGMVFQALLAYPFFLLLDSRQSGLIWLAISFGLALGHGSVYAAQAAFFSELFTTRVRYSGLSLVHQFGALLGGGLSPLICTLLLARFGSWPMVAGYMLAASTLSAACTFGLKPRGIV
jgi:MFS family permease